MASRTAVVLEFERPLVELDKKIRALRAMQAKGSIDMSAELARLERRSARLAEKTFRGLSRWQIVQLSRHPQRPSFLDYSAQLFTDFVELAGDRRFGEDTALVGGVARFGGRPVLVLGQQRGRSTKENLARNFGMSRPEGYRKARRLMDLADRFRLPVLTFVDTKGAYPGIDAEERGQAEAIAVNLEVMSGLGVPVIATIIGEGGSGGALAVGVANRVLMLEYSVYSVISPEGCASILFRDAAKADRAAQALRLTARDQLELGVIDEVISEPAGGAHRDPKAMAETLAATLTRHLAELSPLSSDALVEQRYAKFRRMGAFTEA